ncbi:MAG TPA: Bax inhibitor-1/YccA family protein, partial [Candidatus Baltobacteraceae bacterium]|nr:Bax inhibitor-1/YccA family protein [Candidatus Baltobacteraceae bacterium]
MPSLFKTSNPALNENTFQRSIAMGGEAMTLQGTVNKTGLLLFCASATAAWTWWLSNTQEPAAAAPWMIVGLFGGLILAFATIFKKEWSPITAPLYALAEGLALGGISAFLERSYHGIAIQALGLTLAVTLVMLMLYTSGILRATPRFAVGVIAATGGIFVVYLVDMVLRFFGHQVPFLNSSGPIGIGISVVIVIIAALNLILDFGFVETGVHAGAPKYMEWYGAFGIMVTLVWMYIEILRLLAKMR